MSDADHPDDWRQWLSPDWFSGALMQGSPVASDATRLEHSVVQGGCADHAGNEGMPLTANEGKATNNGAVPHHVVQDTSSFVSLTPSQSSPQPCPADHTRLQTHSPLGFDATALSLQERCAHQRLAGHQSRLNPLADATPRGREQEQDFIGGGDIRYKVVWHLVENKRGQFTTTEEAVDENPASYWRRSLRPKLNEVLAEHDLEGAIPLDTKVVVSAKGRPRQDVKWQPKGLAIQWDLIHDKLAQWADPRRPDRLQVELFFNFKIDPGSNKKAGKRRARTHTERQLEERAEVLSAEQSVSGRAHPLTKSYEFYKCKLKRCNNKGYYCWCDPKTGTHYILLSHDTLQLAQLRLTSHETVPRDLRTNFRTRKIGYRPQPAKSTGSRTYSSNLARMSSVISQSESESARETVTPGPPPHNSLSIDSPDALRSEGSNPIEELHDFFSELKSNAPEPWKDEYDRAKALALDQQLDVSLLAAGNVEIFLKNKVKFGTAHRVVKASRRWEKRRKIRAART